MCVCGQGTGKRARRVQESRRDTSRLAEHGALSARQPTPCSLVTSAAPPPFHPAADFNVTCPEGFTSINQGGVGAECLKLKVRQRAEACKAALKLAPSAATSLQSPKRSGVSCAKRAGEPNSRSLACLQQNVPPTCTQSCRVPQEGQEKAAAFLESRRYGAMLGATTEFSKCVNSAHCLCVLGRTHPVGGAAHPACSPVCACPALTSQLRA